ncbi:hypothetical protein ABIB56_002897 [Glaciihabitans sp. UYNi722]
MGQLTSLGDGLELVRTSPTDWRVVDARALQSDPGRVLGFIERMRYSRYELLWTTEPPRWAYVSSLRLAAAAFATEPRYSGDTEPSRIVEHLPPPARFTSPHYRRSFTTLGRGQDVAR